MKKRRGNPRGAHGVYGRIYNDAEAEFLAAMQRYQDEEKINFPAKSDYFYVLTRVLGYEKRG